VDRGVEGGGQHMYESLKQQFPSREPYLAWDSSERCEMAPWNVSWPFGDSASDLPDSIAPAKGGSDSAFEVFIDGALTRIYNEAGGRSRENRAIREACKAVLGEWACGWLIDSPSLV